MDVDEVLRRDAERWNASQSAVPDLDLAVHRVTGEPSPHELDSRPAGLVEEPPTRHGRRWSKWAPALAAAAVMAIAVPVALYSASPTVHRRSVGAGPTSTAGKWTRRSLPGWGSTATIAVPPGWFTAPFRSTPAPLFFPLLFVSDQPFHGPCAHPGPALRGCTGRLWVPPRWTVSRDQVLVTWGYSERPTGPFRYGPGRRLLVDHRPAVISHPVTSEGCPAGAAHEIDAAVRQSPNTSPGDDFQMTACLGPRVPKATTDAVIRMFNSIRIKPEPPARPSTTPSTTSRAPTSPPARAARRCTVRQINVRIDSYSGTMPGTIAVLHFTNLGTAACTLRGFPHLTVLSVGSEPAHDRVTYQTTNAAWGPIPVQRVTIAAGGSGLSEVLFATPLPQCLSTPIRLAVTPPSMSRHQVLNGNNNELEACPNRTTVVVSPLATHL